MDKNLEQIYRVDYTGDGEHGLTDGWCIIGKSEVPSPYILNSPFENGGGYGAVYIKSIDDKLSESFTTARDLIENFLLRHEDVTTEKVFRIRNPKKNEYWISTPYSKGLNPFVIVNEIFEGLPGYDVCVNAYSSSHAFFIGKPFLDKYLIETAIMDAMEKKIMEISCKICKHYYYRSSEFGETSECRFNPPTVFTYNKKVINSHDMMCDERRFESIWPPVHNYNWCGQFSEREITDGEI